MVRFGPRIARRTGWVLALLPVLLLRAFIPAGFMPATGDGSLALVFCEPGMAQAAGAHAHHHLHGQRDGSGTGHPAAAECPFAQSAAPALPSAATPLYVPPRLASQAPAPHESELPPSVTPRYAAARGPPTTC